MFCRICGGRVDLPPRSVVEDLLGQQPLDSTLAPLPAQERGSDSAELVAPGSSASVVADGTFVHCPACGHGFDPTATVAASQEAPKPGSSDTAGRKTVLLVEDTEFFLNLARDALSNRYHTICATSAKEALQHLGESHIDLLVLDLTLESDDDGLAVLALAAPKRIPCLVFTSKSESELWGDQWDALKAKGATDLVLKGMNVEEQLLAKVTALIPS